MEFKETNCANPWAAAPGSSGYITEVRNHLEMNDITVYSIFIERFDPDTGEICQACNCLTGRKIVISTPDTDMEKAEAMGFTLQ